MSQYNTLMQKAGKRINQKIYYFLGEKKVELTKDQIKRAKPFFSVSLTGTTLKCLEFEISDILSVEFVYFENTVSYGEQSATKNYGRYKIIKKEYNADLKTYTYTACSNFINAMIDYEPIKIEYPTTILNFFKQLCIECGYETNIASLPNGDKILNNDIYENIGFTYRDVYDDIGQATASLFNENNNVVERCLIGKEEVILDDDILKNQNITLGEHFGPINSIILSRSGDSDKIYKRDESLTSWNEFEIKDNQLMNDNNRDEFLEELYNALYGIEFDLYDLELVGFGGFEPLQKIKIVTDGKEFSSYIFSNEEEYTQGYKEVIYNELPSESNTDYSAADKTDKKVNQAYIIVKKQEKKIESLTSEVTETSEKVTKVEQSFEGVKSSVTNVEKGLADTNTNLQNTDKKVKGLEDNLNGLSTNFNDFKDNEYVKDKQYLQDQIDGAIQFWNGSEIPTLNNKPASDWKTEADKNNHRADLYTVIDDSSKPPKQGKTYRFDKVNGVWQWVELTDNELSAVQALAQQALDKSNQNADDIGILNKKASEFEQTDEQIKASVELLDNQYKKDMTLENTVYGNPAYIENASDNSLVENVIYGASKQDTRSGKNLYNYKDINTKSNNVTTDEDGWITVTYDNTSGSSTHYEQYFSNKLDLEIGTTYSIVLEIKNASGKGSVYPASNVDNVGQLASPTPYISFTNGTYVYFRVANEISGDIGLRAFVRFNAGESGSVTFRISVLRGTSITPENFVYEEYGVMPSPEYPSEIKNIEGIENILDMSIYDTMNNNGGNTYDASNHRITFTEDKVAENRGRYRSIVRSFKKGDRVTLTFDLRSSRNSKVKAGIEAVKAMCDVTTEWKRFSTIYNVTKDIDHIMTIFYSDKSSTFEKGDWIEFKDVTLLVNNDYTGYIPYGNKYLVERVTGKNFLTIPADEISLVKNSQRVIQFNLDDNIVLPIGDYTISFPDLLMENNNYGLGFWVRYSEGNSVTQVTGGNDILNNNKNFFTFNLTAQTKINVLYIFVNNNDNDNATATFSKIQLEKGPIATDFEEYKERTYLIPLKKENLFDKNTTTIENKDISIAPQVGKPLGTITDSKRVFIKMNIELLKNKLVNFATTFKYTRLRTFFLDKSENYISTLGSDVNIPFVVSDNMKYLVVILNSDNDISSEIDFGITIYEGASPENYYELSSISDIKDEYDVASGVLTKKINTYIFTGNEHITTYPDDAAFYNDTNLFQYAQDWGLENYSVKYKSTHFTTNSTSFSGNDTLGSYIFNNTIRFRVPTSIANTENEFKNWLTEQYNNGTPVKIEYELNKHYSIQLEPIEVKTFDGVNNIYVEDKYSLVNQNKIVYLTDSFLNTKYASKAELKVESDSIKESINSTLERDYTSKTEFNVTKDLIESLRNKVYDLTNYIKMVTASDVLKLDNTFGSNGAINYLKITNFSSYKKLYPGQQHPSKYTYPGLKSEYTLIFTDRQDAPLSQKEITFISPVELNGNSTVSDEVVIQDNKIKIIQKVDNTGKALSSPIEYDALYADSSSILTTFDNNTFIMLKDEANVKFECEYLMKNELTNRFATTMELMAQQILTEEMWKSTIKKGELSTEIEQTAEIIKFTNGKLIIDMNNFKLDSVGNVTLANGAKIIGGYGLLTSITIPSTILSTEFVGGHMMLPLSPRASLEFQFSIPKNFKVEKAYIVLNHAPARTGIYNGNMTPTYYNGYCRHLKLYKASNISNLLFQWVVDGNIIPATYENTNYTEIPNAFGTDGFTGSSSGNTKVTSIDVKDFINTSNTEDTFNIFTIKTSDLVPEDYTEELKETGICLADLTIIGYMSFDK